MKKSQDDPGVILVPRGWQSAWTLFRERVILWNSSDCIRNRADLSWITGSATGMLHNVPDTASKVFSLKGTPPKEYLTRVISVD